MTKKVKSKGTSSVRVSISRPSAIRVQQSQVTRKAVVFHHQPDGRLHQSTSHIPTGEINILEHIDDVLQLPGDGPEESNPENSTTDEEDSTKCPVSVILCF